MEQRPTSFKEKVLELEKLLAELNNLSVKTYKYKGGEYHKIYVQGKYSLTPWWTSKRIEDLIFIVNALIKYRMAEYEAD